MHYSSLGHLTLPVSRLGFGCMSLGPDHQANAALLHAAHDGGITLFDTADLYDRGDNEITVGRALGARRSRVLLATKVGNQWRPDGSGWDWNPRKAYILQAAEASLRRLGTDYIDLYQLHGGTIDDPIDEAIEAFELLRAQGKIRAYGISSIRPNVIRAYVQRADLASVMMQYSLLDRRPEETALPLLQEQQIGVLARGGLAQGLLAGKPAKPYLGYAAAEVQRAAEAVGSLAGPDRSAAAVALGFVLAQPAVTSAVLGIRTPEQLQQALAAAEAPPLTAAEVAGLRVALTPNTYEQHR